MSWKFVVTDGEFRMGNVKIHKELINKDSTKNSGGWVHINRENKYILFYNESVEFGACSMVVLEDAINISYISPSLNDFTFYYSKEASLANAIKNKIKLEINIEDNE